LDKERLSAIRAKVNIPLVLHGASGLSDEEVRDCIRRGICKVNFATELRVAFTDGVKDVLAKKADVFDPKVLGREGMTRVTELVKARMQVCGCDGKVRR
jgi:tagatose 1,6-diphosphate aldolase GatY/KbaY